MKKHLFLFICLIMAGTLSGQVKSIVVINDVEGTGVKGSSRIIPLNTKSPASF